MEPPRGFCELLECFNANHVIEALTAFGFGDVGLSVTDFQQPMSSSSSAFRQSE